MRLNEIKNVIHGTVDLAEGVIPPHLSMTLGQVIRDGKITNNVQYFVIAGLTSMFKECGPTRWPRDLNDYSMSTSSDFIDAVKSLSDAEAVQISEWLCCRLNQPVDFETNPYANNPMLNITDWMRLVIKHQN